MSDWYVDAAAGSGGDGKSAGRAFRTLAEGAAAASSGDTINVAGGVYKETYAPRAGTVTLGDGEDRFVISGGQPLPGLVPCVAGDAAVVGSAWTGTFKTTVSKSIFPSSDPLSANICEDGEQLPLACERAQRDDTFFLTRPAYYHKAASVETSGALITGYRLPSVTDTYTKAQIENAVIYFVAEPNKGLASAVTFDEPTKTIRMAGGTYTYENNEYKDSFALFNMPAAIRPGEWAFTESGATATVYVRPVNPANVAAGLVEYAARAIGLHVTGGANGVTVRNFVVRQQGCPSKTECPITINADDCELSHFSVRNIQATVGGGYAAIFSRGGDRPHLHHFEVFRAQNAGAMYLSGTGAVNADWPYIFASALTNRPTVYPVTVTGATSGARIVADYSFTTGGGARFGFAPAAISGTFANGETLIANGLPVGQYSLATSDLLNKADPSLVSYDSGGSIHDFDVNYIAGAGLKLYTWRDLAVYRGLVRNASKGAHANTINSYEQCRNILFWGINGEDSDGYATWQEGDGFVLAFCAFSANTSATGGHRAIAQQQNIHSKYPGAVEGWLPNAVLNCRCVPFPGRVADARYGNSLNVTSGNTPLNLWYVHNVIFQGFNGEDFVGVADWDYNVNTQTGGPGAGEVGPNDITSDWSLNYTDAVAGDFSYKADAPVRTFVGKDWSALVSGFKARWPQVPDEVFGTDMLGAAIDWSDPPVGPTVDLDVDYAAARAEAPAVPPVEVPAPPVRPAVRSRVLRLSVTVAAP